MEEYIGPLTATARRTRQVKHHSDTFVYTLAALAHRPRNGYELGKDLRIFAYNNPACSINATESNVYNMLNQLTREGLVEIKSFNPPDYEMTLEQRTKNHPYIAVSGKPKHIIKVYGLSDLGQLELEKQRTRLARLQDVIDTGI